MNIQEFTFQFSKDHIYGIYASPSEIKGLVVLVHGFGEHSGLYLEHVIPTLMESSMAVMTYDNIGHGRSGGKRGHCPGYEALLDVLDKVIDKGKSIFPNKAIILYGHSMGGNIVLNYAMRRENNATGIIATSPYLRLAFQPPRWKMVLGKLMLKLLPSITLPSGLDPKGISRIPAEVKKYSADPLNHDKVSPMYSFPIIDAGAWAITNARLLNTNTLLLHGTADPVIDCGGTEEFHKNGNSTTLKLFEGGYHELHNDYCSAEMLVAVKDWLEKAI